MNTLTPAPTLPVDDGDAAPAHLYQLQTPGGLKPAVTLGLGLPAHVNGLPAFYYWKDAILVGTYHHPARRFSLSMTRDKLDRLVATFGRMRSNGVKVPILMDHAPTAAATLGWIVDVKRRGDRLMELHQFLGTAARDVGLRNQVSLGIDPAFTDGRGETYGEAIVHSAITPLPVVPGQEGFEAVRAVEGGDTAQQPAGDEAPLTLSLVASSTPPVEPPVELHAELIAPPETAALSPAPASVAPAAPALEAAMLPPVTLAAIAKRNAAVSNGCLSPAAAEELFALLTDRSPLLLSSAAGGSDLASAVFDTLARHRPPPLGERTAVQLLTRLVPGQDDDRLELRDRMIALASGR